MIVVSLCMHHFSDMRKEGCMCLIVPFFGFNGDLVHELSQILLGRFPVNVGKTIVVNVHK